MAKKTSPLKINQALIENYKGVNAYTPKGDGTRFTEVSLDRMDKIRDDQLKMWGKKKKKKKKKNGEEEKDNSQENNNNNNNSENNNQEDERFIRYEEEELKRRENKNNQSGLNNAVDPNVVSASNEYGRLNVSGYWEGKGKNKRKNESFLNVNGKKVAVEDFESMYPGASKNPYRIKPVNPDSIGWKTGGVAHGRYEYNSPVTYYSKRFTNRGKTPLFFRNEQPSSDPLVELQMQNPNIERDVDKYISNISLIGDEKLDVLGTQANSKVYNYTKQLKDQANMVIEKEGNNKIVNDSINTLRGLTQQVNNLIDKKAEWIENNGGGESTKRNFSKGSSGKNKFIQNAIFSERDDLYEMILPLPETTIDGNTKFSGIQFDFGNVVVNSNDIFENVFLKPENKFADFRKAAVKINKDGSNKKPYNHYHSEVIVNGLLDSKENILAFAWDDFAGPSFVEQYTDANPNEDPTWMDVDSPNFNENRLRDELNFWLSKKLQREHQVASQTDKIFDEIEKMTTDQLIAKYSK
jgi:hypothetical protein